MFGWYGNFGSSYPFFGSLVALFAVWSLFWKALALWRSARNGEKWWFIAFLVVNTVGLLEILYLFLFTKGEKGIAWLMDSKSSPAPRPKAKTSRRRK